MICLPASGDRGAALVCESALFSGAAVLTGCRDSSIVFRGSGAATA
jgi:hypothetical protein